MDMDRREFMWTAALGAGVQLVAGAAGATPAAETVTAAAKGSVLFSFCVVADPHCAEKPKEGIDQYGGGVDKLLRCVEAMDGMAGIDRPDFVLLAGDIHPWALGEGQLDGVPFTLYATPGNHESSRERRDALRPVFPDSFHLGGQAADYYSVVHRGVRVISLCDAGGGGDHVGHLCSESIAPAGQCEWLERELGAPERRKILFAHIPPEPQGQDRNMYMSRNDSRWFCDLLRDRGPEAAFFGHLHQATLEYDLGGTRCFNVRSCCWNFGKAPLGFLHVRVHEIGLAVREIETGRYS